jgi:drug/metabolite transporter (DMT)-like permease
LKPRYGLYALIFLMVAGWSGNYIVGKIALREFPPLLLGGLRVSIAAALTLPVYWWERRRTGDRWSSKELPLLLLLGFFGVALNQFCFVLGLSRTSAAHSAIFANMTPLVVLVLAEFSGLERTTPQKVAGMLLALGGVVLLKSFEVKHPGGGGPTWTGDLLTFGGCCAFGAFTVLGKPAAKRHSTITVNTIAHVGGALCFAPITIWQVSRFPLGQVSLRGWLCVLYMAAIASVSCYLIYYYALARMKASRLSAFSYFQPPLAAVLGIFLLGEPITVSLIVAMLVIFAGVGLAERAR